MARDMQRIQVMELLGASALTYADGAAVAHLLRMAQQQGVAVELDFEGVTAISGPFVSAALGRFVDALETPDRPGWLVLRGLTPVQQRMLERVLAGVSEFAAASPTLQRRMGRIVKNSTGGCR